MPAAESRSSPAPIQIAGLGLSTLDILVCLNEMPNWQTGGRMQNLAIDGGGLVGTALVAAARLGARTGFIGTYGNDEVGRLKLDLLTRYGVDISQARQYPSPEEQVVLVFVQQQTGERVFTFREHALHIPLRIEDLDREYITSAQYLHIDGYLPDAALQAAKWMHAAGKEVMMDASQADRGMSEEARARALHLVRATDILICGNQFAQVMSGQPDRWDAMEALLAEGPRIVVQTEGARGCFTLTSTERFHTPAFQVQVADTTGAGDVFHGAYLVGLLNGWDLSQNARFASAVSAIKCTHLGGRSGIPTFEETLAFLKNHPEMPGEMPE